MRELPLREKGYFEMSSKVNLRRYIRRLVAWAYAHRIALALGAIMVVAIFFRLWRLGELPPGLHPDEAANGQDVFRIFKGDLRPLYNTNGPREALFHFLLVPFVWLFGNTTLALRLLPALLGVGAVFFTYLFAKEWWSRRAALIAAFLMASAPWAVTLTRDVFRAALVPLIIPLTLWLFTKALRERRWRWYILSGISLGLGFYTYLSFRVVPFIMLAIGIYALIFYRDQLAQYIKPLLVTAAVTTVVLLPLIIFAFFAPDDVIGGRSSVSFLNEDLNNGQPIQTLMTTIGETALMFNFAGDENFRHNLGGEPMLNFFVGVMFVLGLALSLVRIRDIRYFALLAIFGAMLLPEVLTAEGIPHGLRAIGVIPVVYVFAAIGIIELLARWRGVFPRNPAVKTAGLAILLVLMGYSTISNYQRYFVAYANAPETFDAYSEDVVAISNYVLLNPAEESRILVVDGYSIKTVQFLTEDKASFSRIDAHQLESINLADVGEVVVAGTQLEAAEPILRDKNTTFNVNEFVSHNRTGVLLFKTYRPQGE